MKKGQEAQDGSPHRAKPRHTWGKGHRDRRAGQTPSRGVGSKCQGWTTERNFGPQLSPTLLLSDFHSTGPPGSRDPGMSTAPDRRGGHPSLGHGEGDRGLRPTLSRRHRQRSVPVSAPYAATRRSCRCPKAGRAAGGQHPEGRRDMGSLLTPH